MIQRHKRAFWRKQDWRNVRLAKHDEHITIRWFHWSKFPKLVICYWNERTSQQQIKSIKWGKL